MTLTAADFTGSSLLAVYGNRLRTSVHLSAVAVPAGTLLTANRTTPRTVTRLAIQLGFNILLAAGVTAPLPFSGGKMQGDLTAVTSGALASLATVHLLPEAQIEKPALAPGSR